MEDWPRILDEIVAGTERVTDTLSRLTDDDMRAPSALPGWTRGHVGTHIARNADSLWNLLEWARTGVEIPQYPSMEARNADLAAGAGRGAGEIADDVREASARFAAQARRLPDEAWRHTVRGMAGWRFPAWYVMYMRWREVEAHHVDLAAGYGPADWPEPYVRWALTSTLNDLAASPADGWGELAGFRLTATDADMAADTADLGRSGEAEISGPGRVLLAWLCGRAGGEGLAVHPDGPLPTPPPWPHAPSGF
ncbi:maleylpyruvate isomerase family mycothiol-dependent enzyme [Actinomadura sp. NPDC047616]|uniref:maleylpyruvate isomerase family mycothiol-dependent enzyme n=1 Tax=Actinomadura sp. NPDC047616 TaxID=3155914 RepID=UPI0033CB3029